jgi:GAF domain-containing protein
VESVAPAPQLVDSQRLEVLASIDFDHPELRRELDTIVGHTAEESGFPVSLVTLLSHITQFVAGSYGVPSWIREARGTPVEWSFCADVVASGKPQTVEDLTGHARHSINPLVTVDGARSYAGVPLVLDGQVVGAHCVVGTVRHSFTQQEMDTLQRGAREVTAFLQRFRLSAPAEQASSRAGEIVPRG